MPDITFDDPPRFSLVPLQDDADRMLLLIEILTNITCILQGGLSSPDYPANAEGIIGEIKDELGRVQNDSHSSDQS